MVLVTRGLPPLNAIPSRRVVPAGGCTHSRFGSNFLDVDQNICSRHTLKGGRWEPKNSTLTARLSKSRPSSPKTVVITRLQRLASKKRQDTDMHLAVEQDVAAQCRTLDLFSWNKLFISRKRWIVWLSAVYSSWLELCKNKMEKKFAAGRRWIPKGWIAPARASPIWCATSDKQGWCNCKVFVFLVGWETGKPWFYTTLVYRLVIARCTSWSSSIFLPRCEAWEEISLNRCLLSLSSFWENSD